jgi:2'-5' RNA ligase
MRAFISIEFPEEIKNELKKIQEQLPEFKGKNTEPKNLHLTLKFLGEIRICKGKIKKY